MTSFRDIGRAIKAAHEDAVDFTSRRVIEPVAEWSKRPRKGPAPKPAAAPVPPTEEDDFEKGVRTVHTLKEVIGKRGDDSGYKKGGRVRARDGAAVRGKPRGKFI